MRPIIKADHRVGSHLPDKQFCPFAVYVNMRKAFCFLLGKGEALHLLEVKTYAH